MHPEKAIIGYENEVSFLWIGEIINKYNAEQTSFPSWYQSLEDGSIKLGLAGVSEWFNEKFNSSAKIIGDRVYF